MSQKKVGLAIVTYGTNYGTYLQAFATQYIVREIGYDTEIINIDSVKKEVSTARKKYFAKQIFNPAELKSYKHVLIGMVRERLNSSYRAYIGGRKKQFEKFRNENFFFSTVEESWSGLHTLCKENYFAVVVGSDQLWRPANIAGNFYTLNFVPDEVNKIAYATSFGLKDIRENQCEISKHFLSRIDHLSVRERSGAKIVRDLTGRNIPVVCDPTLLLTKGKWSAFVNPNPMIAGKYILCYFLGDNKEHRQFAKRLATASGCKIVGILHIAGYLAIDTGYADETPVDVGPKEFLNLVRNAAYVCTDSFHGCVFAIQFERPLFAFSRFAQTNKMSTNDRITTLLSMLGMEYVWITGKETAEYCMRIQTDYSAVKKRLAAKREESMAYLARAFANEATDLTDEQEDDKKCAGKDAKV